MLVLDAVTKRFGAQVAVDGLTLEVRRGETLGLLGPNGAGKSTTLALMAGVLGPDAGSVTLGEDGDPTDPEVRRQLGLAPQGLALYVRLTAEENLRFFARLHGLSGARLEARIDAALELAGLTARRHDRVATFSGGMARRLNLAAAVVHEPAVVLLDEPTVGVDPQSRHHLLEALGVLRDQGLTLVYSTHYMEEVERLADRVAIIDHGRVLDVGTVTELVGRHGGKSTVIARIGGGLTPPTELRLSTDLPLQVVTELSDSGQDVRSLEVRRPDLESVFLTLTGRSLRDDA